MKRKAKRKRSAKISKHAESALRALRRAGRNARMENRRFGLPTVVWENGKIVSIPA